MNLQTLNEGRLSEFEDASGKAVNCSNFTDENALIKYAGVRVMALWEKDFCLSTGQLLG